MICHYTIKNEWILCAYIIMDWSHTKCEWQKNVSQWYTEDDIFSVSPTQNIIYCYWMQIQSTHPGMSCLAILLDKRLFQDLKIQRKFLTSVIGDCK